MRVCPPVAVLAAVLCLAPPPAAAVVGPVGRALGVQDQVSELEREGALALAEFGRACAARARAGASAPHPARAAWPRFESLVERGWADGRAWLLEHLEHWDAPPPARRLRRGELIDALLDPEQGFDPRGIELALLELARRHDELADGTRIGCVRGLDLGRADAGLRAAAVLAELTLAPPADGQTTIQRLDGILERWSGTAAARVAADEAFLHFERTYRGDVDAWARSWSSAERSAAPAPHPAETAFARAERLAREGSGRALWWMVREASNLELEPQSRTQLRAGLLAQLIERHANDRWLADALQFSAGLAADLGPELLHDLGGRLLERTDDGELAVTVLNGMASWLAADEGDPWAASRAIAAYERLLAEFPEHPLAAAAGPRLFALRHLRVGQVPPDRTAIDGRGRRFRLSDHRGRVVLLAFWGYWSPRAELDLARLGELGAALAGEPFSLLGVNSDDGAEDAQARFGAGGRAWANTWEGGRSGPWTHAWNVRECPTYFLLDTAGRVLGKGNELDEIVPLLDQELERLRGARGALAPPVERAGS
jgi:hypothetical protein